MDDKPATQIDSNVPSPEEPEHLSEEEMILVSSVHQELFIRFTKTAWIDNKMDALKRKHINIVKPAVMSYKVTANLIQKYHHVLGKAYHSYEHIDIRFIKFPKKGKFVFSVFYKYLCISDFTVDCQLIGSHLLACQVVSNSAREGQMLKVFIFAFC